MATPFCANVKTKTKRMIRMTTVTTVLLDKTKMTQEELGMVMVMINRIQKYDVEKAQLYLDALENPHTNPKTKNDLYQELMYCIQMYEA